MDHTLLPKRLALPVFASDAISSVAYATQQIVLALGAAGLWAATQHGAYTHFTMLITGLIVLLLLVVVISYWQTIFGYPSGGGSYIVSKDNLGTMPGLIAAAALLIDYVLTVSVSIAAGVQNLESGSSVLTASYRASPRALFAALYRLADAGEPARTQGVRNAVCRTYLSFRLYVLRNDRDRIVGPFLGWHFHTEYVNHEWHGPKLVQAFGIVVLLRAFANGCSAMTGTEAVSNGIPAFRPHKSRNAALTLVAMGAILGTIFLGISTSPRSSMLCTGRTQERLLPPLLTNSPERSFGKTGSLSWAYLTTQIATALILVLAANTSFADFPRLASILAHDKFLPKQLANLGDKLVFNNGILILGVFAALLIVMKNGSVDALIPLYAIGVFLAFTLSQSGMVVHWWKEKGKGWQRKALINGIGAMATLLVLADIAFEKFTEGAWAVIILIVLLVIFFQMIHAHYTDATEQTQLHRGQRIVPTIRANTVLVLVPGLHRGVLPALEYGKLLSRIVVLSISNSIHRRRRISKTTGRSGGAILRW